MHIVRRFLLVIVVPLFLTILLALAINIGVNHTAGNKKFVKQVIAASGIYNSVSDQLLDQGKSAVGPYGTSVSLNDPQVRQAAHQVLTSSVAQTNSEIVIDSLYNWLDGKTPQPDFKIDLTPQKNQLADKVSVLAVQKASALPPCAAGYSLTSFDVFTATCLPPGVTPAAVSSTVKADLSSGNGLLDNPVITAQTLKGDGKQDPFSTPKAKNIPKAYQASKKSPWGLVVLAVVMVAFILFLCATRKTGFKTLGIILLVTGALILIWATASKVIFTREISKIKLDNKVLQTNVRSLAYKINSEVEKNSLIIGAIYSLLGVLAIVLSIRLKDETLKLEAEPIPEAKNSEPPAAASPKNPKRYKKISL